MRMYVVTFCGLMSTMSATKAAPAIPAASPDGAAVSNLTSTDSLLPAMASISRYMTVTSEPRPVPERRYPKKLPDRGMIAGPPPRELTIETTDTRLAG